jgi:hypothetical protein
MQKKRCSHFWEMINVASGLVVMKKCFHCRKVSTCFVFHHDPPLEPCREQSHFWNYEESDESFHFDLRCAKCDTLVKLDELVCLMKCTGCDEKCRVCIFTRSFEPEDIQVYIAMGRRPIEERRQLSQEQFSSLEAYFNQQSGSLKRKVKIVRHEMVKDLDKCYAEVIRDTDMLFATSEAN